MSLIKQGEIYQYKLDSASEETQYCLVISSTQFNSSFQTSLIIPILKGARCSFFGKKSENFLLQSHLLEAIKIVEREKLLVKIADVQPQLLKTAYTELLSEYRVYCARPLKTFFPETKKDFEGESKARSTVSWGVMSTTAVCNTSDKDSTLKSGKKRRSFSRSLKKKQPRPKSKNYLKKLKFNSANDDYQTVQHLLKTKHVSRWDIEELIANYGYQSIIEMANLMLYSKILSLMDDNRITVQILINWLLDGGVDYVMSIVDAIYHPIVMALIKEEILIPEDIGLWSLVFDTPTIIKHAEVVNQTENKMGIRRGVCTVWDVVSAQCNYLDPLRKVV